MKVIILDPYRQLYLSQQGAWTDSAHEARDFAFTANARTTAQGLRLKNYQVLFYFPDFNYRVVVCESPERTPAVKG